MAVKLLILSNLNSESIFLRGALNRALQSGLASQPFEVDVHNGRQTPCALDWRIHNPLSGAPDLADIDVVLTWCHHIEGCSRAVRQCAIDIEQECRELGIPVVNSARKLRMVRHSFCLRRWLIHGIPCAISQPFTTLDDIVLRYPMILRVDGGAHSSHDSFLVSDRAEAESVIRERGRSGRNRLNLAIEYLETRFADGYYRKRRCIVVGGRVLPRQHMLSRTWKVKLGAAESNAIAVAEDREFIAGGEERADLVARAARALDCDLLAIDYSPAPDGRYVFWEANKTFRMAGIGNSPKSVKFRAATGRSAAECIAQRNAVGAALAELLVEKAVSRLRAAPCMSD
jgi:glutathione synthase/RimK-type ligase-like ATP-grasp enzyme